MRGRKPKPIERQIAEGDPRKHGVHKLEQRAEAGPKPAPGLPSCPKHLKGRARSAWKSWSEELEAMKLDKRPDGQMLEGACWAYANAVQAELIVQKDGPIITEHFINDAGEAIALKARKHPAVEIRNRSWLIMKAFCSEFGLSPVSRTRLTVEKPDDGEEDFAALLSGPRVKREVPAPLMN